LRWRDVSAFQRALAKRRDQCEATTVVLASVGAHMAFMLSAVARGAPGKRIISVLYGSEALRFERNILWRWLARKIFRRVEAIVTVSEFSKTLIERSFLSAFGKKILVAPCACSSAALVPVATKIKSDGRVRILTLARIHPRKGQIDVARALGKLPDELRQRVVYQIGGTGDANYLRRIELVCQQAMVAFEYLGEVSPRDLAATYAQCDIFAMTSRQLARSVEGFGIAYLDAGFHRKPIIAYRTGGVAEAVKDGETGLLAEEGNEAALAENLAQLISDETLRERLGAGGYERASQRTWDDAANIFLKQLEKSSRW
jgi:glycosyltransferase involved in cell wall biosynthesis